MMMMMMMKPVEERVKGRDGMRFLDYGVCKAGRAEEGRWCYWRTAVD
jgi:threonine/homoserine efflux transporter RhtA